MEGNGEDRALHNSPSRIPTLPLFQDGVSSPGASPRGSRRYTSPAMNTLPQEDIDDPPLPELPFPATTAVRDTLRTRSTGSVPRPRRTGMSASVEDEERVVEWIAPLYKAPTDARQDHPKAKVNGQSAVDLDLDNAYPIGTVGRRLQHTLKTAKEEQSKYGKQGKLLKVLAISHSFELTYPLSANMANWAVNIAMFSQIVSNAIITGLSASGGGRQSQIGVAALGALGTIVSAFLARVRGTQEPERSKAHSQNLEKYIRELRAFIEDHGMSTGREHDDRVAYFRDGFNRLQTAIHQAENGQPLSPDPIPPSLLSTTPASTIAPSEKSVMKP